MNWNPLYFFCINIARNMPSLLDDQTTLSGQMCQIRKYRIKETSTNQKIIEQSHTITNVLSKQPSISHTHN